MARTSSKRASAGRKGGRATARTSERTYQNYRDTILEWSERPAVRYVAGGIGLALLGRFAYSMSERYPEISRFLRENLDTVEDKLKEFRGLGSEDREIEARH